MPPRPSTPEPRDVLPLKPVDLLILLALSGGERHGYGLLRDMAEQTDGAVQLEAGNLYRSIKRLTDDGLVAETARRPPPTSTTNAAGTTS